MNMLKDPNIDLSKLQLCGVYLYRYAIGPTVFTICHDYVI